MGEQIKTMKVAGQFTQGGLPHGHIFLRLQDIRGYGNFLFDMLDEENAFLRWG